MSNNSQIYNFTNENEIKFLEKKILSLNKLYNYSKLNITDNNMHLIAIDNLLYYTNNILNIKKISLTNNYNSIKNYNSKKRLR